MVLLSPAPPLPRVIVRRGSSLLLMAYIPAATATSRTTTAAVTTTTTLCCFTQPCRGARPERLTEPPRCARRDPNSPDDVAGHRVEMRYLRRQNALAAGDLFASSSWRKVRDGSECASSGEERDSGREHNEICTMRALTFPLGWRLRSKSQCVGHSSSEDRQRGGGAPSGSERTG